MLALLANVVIYSTSPPTPTHTPLLISLSSCLFSVRGNKFAHNLNNYVGRRVSGGKGGGAFLAELRSESQLLSHSSPPNTVCTCTDKGKNCAAISNLNCCFLCDAVDSLPPFDHLRVCCLSFSFAFLFSPAHSLPFTCPPHRIPTPPPDCLPPSLLPSLPPSHCHCHPPETAPWCHSQGQREHC